MKIPKFVDSVPLEIGVLSDVLTEPFKFQVQPLGEPAFLAATKKTDGVTSMAADAVVGWEFMDGDQPLPCTSENKALYIGRFAMYKVVTVNGKGPSQKGLGLAAAIVDFASNPDNFLKH